MSSVIGALIGILVVLCLIAVVYWAIQQLLPLIPLPEPFARIVHVILVVILALIVIWLILVLLGAAGVRVPGPFRFGDLTGGASSTIPTGTAVDLYQLLIKGGKHAAS